jgi:hypothetical protein
MLAAVEGMDRANATVRTKRDLPDRAFVECAGLLCIVPEDQRRPATSEVRTTAQSHDGSTIDDDFDASFERDDLPEGGARLVIREADATTVIQGSTGKVEQRFNEQLAADRDMTVEEYEATSEAYLCPTRSTTNLSERDCTGCAPRGHWFRFCTSATDFDVQDHPRNPQVSCRTRGGGWLVLPIADLATRRSRVEPSLAQ